MELEETLVTCGGEVKALGESGETGKLGGYLVLFGGPDSPDISAHRDFFSASTNYGDHKSTPVFYHHTLDATLGNRKLDEDAEIGQDEVGVWIQAQLDLRDRYEKAVYKLAQKGKVSWSSGTANHLVRRAPVETAAGTVNHVSSWPLGLDASLTPTPANPAPGALVLAVKSLPEVPTFEALCAALETEVAGERLVELTDVLAEVKANAALLAEAMGDVKMMGTSKMPMGDDKAWDAGAAVGRVRMWASSDGSGDKEKVDWGKYARAFMWHDKENAEDFGSYKLPVSDVEDGKLVVMPRAVMAAMGGHGVDAADIPEPDKKTIRGQLEEMRARMKEHEGRPISAAKGVLDGEGVPAAPGVARDMCMAAMRTLMDRMQWCMSEMLGEEKSLDERMTQCNEMLEEFHRKAMGAMRGIMAGEMKSAREVHDVLRDGGLLDGLPLEQHSQSVLAAVSEYTARMRDLRDTRALKAGRVLSQANRDRLAQLLQGIEGAAKELSGLLVETEPKGSDEDALRAAIRRMQTKHLKRKAMPYLSGS